MVWVAFAGILLQVIGLYMAITGVGKTYKEVLDRDLWSDVRADVRRWVQTKLLRRKPEPVVMQGSMAATAHSTGTAFGQVRPSKPADDAPVEVQVSYLMRLVDILAEEASQVRRHSEELVRDAETRTSRRIDQVSDRLAETDKRLTSVRGAVLGQDGKGLRQAGVGLSITLGGVLLTSAGLPW